MIAAIVLGAVSGILGFLPLYMGPVSYTHLDVYKRQHSGRAIFDIRTRTVPEHCFGTVRVQAVATQKMTLCTSLGTEARMFFEADAEPGLG